MDRLPIWIYIFFFIAYVMGHLAIFWLKDNDVKEYTIRPVEEVLQRIRIWNILVVWFPFIFVAIFLMWVYVK